MGLLKHPEHPHFMQEKGEDKRSLIYWKEKESYWVWIVGYFIVNISLHEYSETSE